MRKAATSDNTAPTYLSPHFAQCISVSIDMSLCAFIYVLIDTPSHGKKFLAAIVQDRAVMECHHITGEYLYLLKVRVKDTQ